MKRDSRAAFLPEAKGESVSLPVPDPALFGLYFPFSTPSASEIHAHSSHTATSAVFSAIILRLYWRSSLVLWVFLGHQERASLYKVGWLIPPVIPISLCMTDEIVQWAKALATKPSGLHSISRTHTVEGEICEDIPDRRPKRKKLCWERGS